MTAREVHPVAALFPMLADDELDELAADIAERGLLHPVVLDSEGRVLDGRNRLAACERVGIEPAFVRYDGGDADGYALAVNIARRNLTIGGKALIAARAARLNGHSTRAVASDSKLNQARVAQAGTILDYASELADLVLAGSKPFDAAYREAQQRKQAKQSAEAKMARLRAEAADLADLVIDERMALDEALAALNRREIDRRRDIEAARIEAGRIVTVIRSAVVTVVTGSRLGEQGLVTKDMVREIRESIDLLEGEL